MEQKEILSKFFKEDTFKQEVVNTPDPHIEVAPLHVPDGRNADEDEVNLYWEKLRHFFQTGDAKSHAPTEKLHPLLLSGFLKRDELSTDFPYYLAPDITDSQSLSTLLDQTFQSTFNDQEALILKENLPRLEGYFRKNCRDKNLKISFLSVAQAALNELKQLEVHGEEGKRFLEDINTFTEALPSEGWMIEFTPNAPFLLLDHILTHDHYVKRADFVDRIIKLKSGIREILAVENGKSGSTHEESDLDFAGSMIEFEKLGQMMPESASEEMPQSRKQRLEDILIQLNEAEELLLGFHAHIIINEELFQNEKYIWEILFSNSKIQKTENGNSCISAFNTFRQHIEPFTEIIAAVRIATLELDGRYQEEVHNEYFKHFNWRQFSEEELSVFPPVILVAHTQEMLDEELADFSRLLASNKPIKLFAVQHEHPFEIKVNGNRELDFYTYKQELGALAIAHRDAFTSQDAMTNPGNILAALNTGLLADSPAVFNVLAPWNHNDPSALPFLNVSAAVESRQFPIFTYDQDKGEQWGSRFNIKGNPQASKLWPVYPVEYQDQDGQASNMELPFTYADYYALEPSHKGHLMHVPQQFWTDHLIPLAEYIQLPVDKIYGKIPFIWMVNEKNELQKVAIPFSVVISSKERLDYWNFIQEMGGINSYHVDQAIQKTKKELEIKKAEEIDQIKEDYQEEIEEVRSKAAGEAMEQLASILLDLENLESPSAPVQKTQTTHQEEDDETLKETSTSDIDNEEEEEEEEVLLNSEPWLETMRCTSCNDCVDMFPAVFKYNDDKQAYIADASNATYAQLVQAAEACPAACIHPGLPDHPDEEGMAELIKRAKPFN